MLYYIRQRVVKVRDGVGWLPVFLRPSVNLGGMKGRFFSGCCGEAGRVPDAVAREIKQHIPRELAGASVFNFSRKIKYICRHQLGPVDSDLQNPLLKFMLPLLPGLPTPPPVALPGRSGFRPVGPGRWGRAGQERWR